MLGDDRAEAPAGDRAREGHGVCRDLQDDFAEGTGEHESDELAVVCALVDQQDGRNLAQPRLRRSGSPLRPGRLQAPGAAVPGESGAPTPSVRK